MIFGKGSERFEMAFAEWAPDTPNGPGDDLLFGVYVECGGFTGGDQVWVAETSWARFVEEFRTLERTRRGEAVLVGVLPEDLEVHFAAYDRAGHMMLSGTLRHRRYCAGELRALTLAFHLEFDPGDVAPALAEFESIARPA